MIIEYKEMKFQLTPRDKELLGMFTPDTTVPVESAEELLLRAESALMANELQGLNPQYLASFDLNDVVRKRVVELYLRSMIDVIAPYIRPSFDEIDDFLRLNSQTKEL